MITGSESDNLGIKVLDIYIKGFKSSTSKSIQMPLLPATVIKDPKALKMYMAWKNKQRLIDKTISKSFVFNERPQLDENTAQYFESEEDQLWS